MVLAVLIPLIVMVVACLLERFEAHAASGESARRAARATRTALPSTERPRHLALVPGTGGDLAPERSADPLLDPATLRLTLPKAS